MIIQNTTSNLAAASTNQRAIERQSFATPQDKIAASQEKTADSITLSQEAHDHLASEHNTKVRFTSTLSESAHADPTTAKQLAHDFAYSSESTLVDISNMDLKTGTGVRYVSTGELVTKESEDWFAQEATRVRQDRIGLYQTEKAKGTSDADIFDKMIAAMDNQPERYLQLRNWERGIS